ncbi:MAG: hypothetical protein HY821_22880 [Acidobacteria bacterium]|nr:hypothetical protein [Acidobacteriota bacterium]
MTLDYDDGIWKGNYFSYFTEVEEHFQRARGTGLFLLSPLDWALIETWKNAGVPLEAVLKGIDEAFEKWRSRKQKTQTINGLGYCAQAVMQTAERMAQNLPAEGAKEVEPPFPLESVRAHLEKARKALEAAGGYEEIAAGVGELLAKVEEHYGDLQDLDLRLTALEDKMAALARTRLSDEALLRMRKELEFQLRPYRAKMSADQLSRLEKSFLDRKVYEESGLPRLSLFYIA